LVGLVQRVELMKELTTAANSVGWSSWTKCRASSMAM
jgi:hypothetical protein